MENELTVRVERPAIPAMSWNKDEVERNLDEMLAAYIRKVALVHALRESFPATFGSLYDESEVPVNAEASYREVENEQPEIGAMQPRKLKPKKEQPEPFAVETTDTNDDPFGGDAE